MVTHGCHIDQIQASQATFAMLCAAASTPLGSAIAKHGKAARVRHNPTECVTDGSLAAMIAKET